MADNPLTEALVEALREVREARLVVEDYRTVYLLTLALLAQAEQRITAQDRTIARFHQERLQERLDESKR